MQVDFTTEELQSLLNYLGSRPWAEVNPIIGPLLQKLEAQRQRTGQGEQPQPGEVVER